MSTQKFYASPTNTFAFSNGAVGQRPTSHQTDCLGPYARVTNCPIAGTGLRLTCYATGYADTFFSVPAATQHRGKHVTGFFMCEDGNIEFHVMDKHRERVGIMPMAPGHVADGGDLDFTP
jgi:hypothetical protein